MKVIAVAVGSFFVLSNGQYRVAPWHEGLAPPLRQMLRLCDRVIGQT